MLDETDLTSDYDRLNFTAGPWMWGPSYDDPWYTRSTMIGLRAGATARRAIVPAAISLTAPTTATWSSARMPSGSATTSKPASTTSGESAGRGADSTARAARNGRSAISGKS